MYRLVQYQIMREAFNLASQGPTVYSPVSGAIVGRNDALDKNPS
jgi:hypothetical protein